MPSPLAAPRHNKASNTTEKGRERALELLHAARSLFAAEGYAGLSMRRVGAAVGMSLGNVQHYYQSKDALMEALLRYSMDVFQAKIDDIGSSMREASRIERFVSMLDMFLAELADPITHAIFFEIWALASRNDFASALMDEMAMRERKTIYKIIHGLNPALSDAETMRRAVLIVAQVEGMMLFRMNRSADRAELQALHASLRRALINLATVA